jgi:hypothetical protein
MPYKTIRIKGGARVAMKNTSGRPDKEVAKLVQFALAELNVDATAVHVKKFGRGSHIGMAYYHLPGMASADIPWWCRSLITVRISGHYQTWQQELVNTTAHEGRHIDDYRQPGRYRANKRSRHTEASARAWAAKRESDYLALVAA